MWAGAAAGLAVAAAQAQGDRAPAPLPASGAAAAALDASDWTRPLAGRASAAATAAAATPASAPSPAADAEELDVVDAHWMALTMWGEARGQGEEAMRAVGHVIANRRRTGAHGAYVTDTVSEAFQFSCWNPGDPNRQAMLDVLSLPKESKEHLLWLAARRMADEILSGRSADPTGGALFYHSEAVAPDWSRGLVPVRRIGTHLFFRSARRA
jgi:spore germination cell wall hydrolase CwlJ-like protein